MRPRGALAPVLKLDRVQIGVRLCARVNKLVVFLINERGRPAAEERN